MFSSVSAESTARLLEAKSIIDLCRNSSLKINEHIDDSILMGTVYVLLYGALEYTITNCSYTAINQINTQALQLYDVQPTLWGMIFDPDCSRMESIGTNKKWENRFKLFSQLNKNQAVQQISNVLFPSSNGNIKDKQINRVWMTFGIKSPMYEPGHEYVQSSLVDLAEGRMAVAHGREKASQRGALKSISELSDLYDSISRYCSYLIQCFDLYISNKEFLQV